MAKFDSVVMYGSWLEVARSKLSEEDTCKMMVQLMEYGLYKKIPHNTDVIMDVIFDMARPNIDSNIEKKLNGAKGGRKAKSKSALTSGLSNANANGNVNANGNGNANACAHPSASVPVNGDTASDADNDEWWNK